MKPHPLLPALLTVSILLVVTTDLRSELYASENFDYPAGAEIAAPNGGTGFGGSWRLESTGSGASAAVVPGLSLAGFASSGSAMQISAESDGGPVTGTLSRPFGSTTPANGTLCGSFLIRQTSETVPTGEEGTFSESGIKFTRESQREYFVNPKSTRGTEQNFHASIGIFKDPLAFSPEFDLLLNETFLVVFVFENVNYGAYTENVTTATFWVLDQADLAAIKGNFTVEQLNAHHQATATHAQKFEFGTSTLTPETPFQLFAQMGTVTFDEIRLGPTLADVTLSLP